MTDPIEVFIEARYGVGIPGIIFRMRRRIGQRQFAPSVADDIGMLCDEIERLQALIRKADEIAGESLCGCQDTAFYGEWCGEVVFSAAQGIEAQRAETTAVECEASQSGAKRNAQTQSSTPDNKDKQDG